MRKLVRRSQINADAQLGFAQCALGKRQPRKAHEAATSAPGLVYHNPKAHYIAARALSELGRLKKAVAHLDRAIAQSPVFPDAHRLLEFIYAKRDDRKSAARHRELAETAQQRLDDLKSRADIHHHRLRRGDRESAINRAACERVSRWCPGRTGDGRGNRWFAVSRATGCSRV